MDKLDFNYGPQPNSESLGPHETHQLAALDGEGLRHGNDTPLECQAERTEFHVPLSYVSCFRGFPNCVIGFALLRHLYPRWAHNIATAIPVLPEVALTDMNVNWHARESHHFSHARASCHLTAIGS